MTASGVAHSTVHHPSVLRHERERASHAQLRVADAITTFAGSMAFVYLHALAFGAWIWWAEPPPWPALTLVVSLEAIFLSTFVLIGQNRQASFQRAKADHDFVEEEMELHTNTELTRQIHALTTELHARLLEGEGRAVPETPGRAPASEAGDVS